MNPPLRPTHLEVDLGAVRDNVARLVATAAPAAVCAVVKADGYGHGAVPVARAALEAGATWLAVALVEEGEALRDAGIDAPVLVLAEPPPSAAPRLAASDLTASVYTPDFAEALAAAGRRRGRAVPAHVCLDTGMGRVGIAAEHAAPLLAPHDGLDVTGIWTHFARADEPEATTTGWQLERFHAALAALEREGRRPPLVHAANSAGTLLHPSARFDLVRCGIAVYGLSPAPTLAAESFGLRQALRLVSAVSFVKRIPAGTSVSYGHRWTAPADGWLATVPVGYADGVPRSLTNRAQVLIGGVRRTVAGAITMDQLLVWCGDDEVAAGDEVVLLGRQGGEAVSVDEWAHLLDTISYEVACAIGARVPRTHVG